MPDTPRRPAVLVVDDNAALADNLLEILQDAGYAARTSSSCASARLELAGEVDLALVDLRLPDGDGGALAGEIKERKPGAEVILLTGNATVESAADSVRAGAFAYLIKPCATPLLLLTVEQAMRSVRLRRDKQELARRNQIAEKLAAVGTLTAGLSHEIRNPLNAAGLQLNVLERRVRKLAAEGQAPLLEPLLLVRDEIRRLDHILEDFLQFARPVNFTPHPVALKPLVDRVCALEQGPAERRGVRIEAVCPDALEVPGHEGRLQQVLVNLVMNALDATPRGGRIRLAAHADEGDAVLTVEDEGSGIPTEALPHVFEPFFTTKPSGSGLGLPIVHAIVTQHGGTIRVENLPAGGARVTVRVPRVHG
jgi:two-component system sensor histidine kinase HydH